MRYFFSIYAAAAIVAVPVAAAADDFAGACRRFASARVVFIGRVTAPPVRKHVPGQEQIDRMRQKWSEADAEMAKRKLWPVPLDLVVTPMRVETAFRNIDVNHVYVRTEDPDELQIGQSYLVYGHHEIGAIFPEILTATALVAQPDPNGEEVRFLNLAKTRKFSTSVYGSLILHDTPAEVPLAGVRIRFTVGDQQIDGITNAAGRFIVTGIPAGIISVEPLLPEGVSFDTHVPYTLAMPDGGCSELQLRARRDRRIRGRLRHPDGSPIARAFVDLVPLAAGQSRWRSRYQTGENGEFEFRGLSPRAYLLGLNLDSRPTPRAPYNATYYPTPLEVDDVSKHDEVEWVLSDPLPTGDVEVVVSGGRGSLDVVSACAIPLAADGDRDGFAEHIPHTARGSAPVIIPVVEGVRYRIVARASIGDRNMDSVGVELVGRAGRQPITMQVSVPAQPNTGICEASF